MTNYIDFTRRKIRPASPGGFCFFTPNGTITGMPPQNTNNVWPPAPLSDVSRQKSEKLRLSQRIAPSFLAAVAANVLVLLALISRLFLRRGELYDDFGDSLICVMFGVGVALANIPYSFYCMTKEGVRRKVTAVIGLFFTFTPIPVYFFLQDWLTAKIGYLNKS